ncbi:hypothetical protein EDB86DRAFT_1289016 [Lactarius hatsudake]|nr:hypothetical protein EDB86DRAFT_1289016 [Lactarius hatsudake]
MSWPRRAVLVSWPCHAVLVTSPRHVGIVASPCRVGVIAAQRGSHTVSVPGGGGSSGFARTEVEATRLKPRKEKKRNCS